MQKRGMARWAGGQQRFEEKRQNPPKSFEEPSKNHRRTIEEPSKILRNITITSPLPHASITLTTRHAPAWATPGPRAAQGIPSKDESRGGRRRNKEPPTLQSRGGFTAVSSGVLAFEGQTKVRQVSAEIHSWRIELRTTCTLWCAEAPHGNTAQTSQTGR